LKSDENLTLKIIGIQLSVVYRGHLTPFWETDEESTTGDRFVYHHAELGWDVLGYNPLLTKNDELATSYSLWRSSTNFMSFGFNDIASESYNRDVKPLFTEEELTI